MSRNNQSRLGVPRPANSVDPVGAMPQTHISYTVPTEFVDLPSRGLFYPPNHPLHGKESVEIKQMTAKEEDILTSDSLIKKGIVLDRLIQSILVDKLIDPTSLLVCDRNAIFVAARISGYGADYDAEVACPSCGFVHEINYDLDSFKFKQPEKRDDVSLTSRGSCVVKLPKSQKLVEFRLLVGYDEKQISNADKSNKEISAVTDQLKSLILTVDNDPDIAQINAFVMNMPAFDSRFLRKAIKDMTPNTDFAYELLCEKCGFESVSEVPIGTKFFWPDL